MSSNPPDAPDTGELEKLLKEFEDGVQDLAFSQEAYSARGVGPESSYAEEIARIESARKSVLDLFERLQAKERESQRRLEMADGLIKAQNADYQSMEAELSALRSTALTRDEAAAPLVGEMIAQARLGHQKFCVGTHEHEGGELEYEWIDWSEAFARLSSLRSSSLGEQKT